MNAYPGELILHHFPLLLLSGLVPSSSASSSPDDLTQPTQVFPALCADLRAVIATRGRDTLWDPARARSTAFKTVFVEHSHRLPSRKSRPLPRGLSAASTSTSTTTEGAEATSSVEEAQAAAVAALTAQPSRSPLSPTHPASALWPDGMIAPTWARRYREAVGSVWVMLAVLPSVTVAEKKQEEGEKKEDDEAEEGGKEATVPQGDSEDDAAETERLREYDDRLIKAITERKRGLSERGIKLTVVLLTERHMLDSPTLEPRLSHIRRSSTLDSKASLFVLTPLSRPELSSFLTSLHTLLFPAAVDYYLEHARRLRRKRARYPPVNGAVQEAASVLRGPQPPPLSREGWGVRAEYKLGTFVELAGDTPSAITHYVAAYQGILSLLRSTAALPPRTKRWAEAKVLADTLSLRVVRLYLYDARSEDATRQFAEHTTKLGELSAGWGMGAESAEWWSWAGKQYRLVGDLTDMSLRQTPLPPLAPLVPPLPPHLVQQPFVPHAQARGPPAFWFAAGLCAVERKIRFVRMKGEESEPGAGGGWSVLEHERKVDHDALIAEAFTRSDDLAKKAGHALTAPSLATTIASAHIDAGSSTQALRYLDGVVKAYGPSHSPDIADVLLLLAKCAREGGEVDAEVRALLEVLRADVPLTSEQRDEAGAALATVMAEKELPKDKGPIRVASEAEGGLLTLDAAFLTSEADLASSAPFQVRLTAPANSKLACFTFEALRIFYDDDRPPIVVVHEEGADISSQLVQLKTVAVDGSAVPAEGAAATADLRWDEGALKVFQGSVTAEGTRPVRISRVELKTGGERLPIELSIALRPAAVPQEPTQPTWYTSASPPKLIFLPHCEDLTQVSFRRRPHRLGVEVQHASVAYLDDATPLTIVVKNDDSEPLHVTVDAMLHSAPTPDAKDMLLHPSSTVGISGSLRDIALGVVAPGTQRKETIFVKVQQAWGFPRSMDVFVRSVPPAALEAEPQLSPGGTSQASMLTCEVTETVTFDTRAMFSSTHAASWRPPRGTVADRPRTPRLTGEFDETASEGADSFAFGAEGNAPASTVAELTSCIHVVGDTSVSLQSITLHLDPSSKHLRLEGSGAAEEADQLTGEWSNGDRWGGMHEIEVVSEGTASPEASDGTVKPTGHLEVTWKRVDVEGAPELNKSLLPLPVLLPPHLTTRLLVAAPPVAVMDQPFVALLTVVNPHPALTADVYVGIEPSDAFLIAGPRTMTIPSLVPRSTRSVPLRIVPRGEGRHALPRVRAWDRRQRFLAVTAVAADSTGTGVAPAANPEEDNYGEPHQAVQGSPASVVNERAGLGIPLNVRFRHSGGSGANIGAQRALQAEAQAGGPRLPPALISAERKGAALSVLVLRP